MAENYEKNFISYGSIVGIVLLLILPPVGNLIIAGVMGFICVASAMALGGALGYFIDTLQAQPKSDISSDDHSFIAMIALIIGTIGLLAWLLPGIGIPIGIIGFYTGKNAINSSNRKLALIGLGLSIFCLYLSFFNGYLGVLMGMTSEQPYI